MGILIIPKNCFLGSPKSVSYIIPSVYFDSWGHLGKLLTLKSSIHGQTHKNQQEGLPRFHSRCYHFHRPFTCHRRQGYGDTGLPFKILNSLQWQNREHKELTFNQHLQKNERQKKLYQTSRIGHRGFCHGLSTIHLFHEKWRPLIQNFPGRMVT